MTISYNTKKSCTPIFWIDTSIIIAIARILSGKSNEPSQGKNAKMLYDFLYKGVRNGELLCPQGDQRDEVFKSRSVFRSVDSALSLGVNFRDRFSIQDFEIRKMMSAYISNDATIDLSYIDAFKSDPCSPETTTSRIFTDVDIDLTGDITQATARKRSIAAQMDALRKKNLQNSVSFETQFQDEVQGDLIAMDLAAERIKSARKIGRRPDFNDLGALEKYRDMLSDWSRISGKTNDIAGFKIFCQSAHYRAAPHINISSMIAAKLLTSGSPIEPGDAMDINHASTIIPYANYFITDRKKRNTLVELEIDKRFDCKVYYLGDVAQIISEFCAS